MVRLCSRIVPAFALLLVSCGGGGGTPAPAPQPNRAPAITSPATATIDDDSAGTVYQTTATDPDGGALAFSLVGAGLIVLMSLSGAIVWTAREPTPVAPPAVPPAAPPGA